MPKLSAFHRAALPRHVERHARAAVRVADAWNEQRRPYHDITLLSIMDDGNNGAWEVEVTIRPHDMPRPTLLLEGPKEHA